VCAYLINLFVIISGYIWQYTINNIFRVLIGSVALITGFFILYTYRRIVFFVLGIVLGIFVIKYSFNRDYNFILFLGILYQTVNAITTRLFISSGKEKTFLSFFIPTFVLILMLILSYLISPVMGVHLPQEERFAQCKEEIINIFERVINMFNSKDNYEQIIIVDPRKVRTVAKIRSEPYYDTSNQNVIGSVKPGTELVILDRKEDLDGSGRKWIKVKIPGKHKTGWICERLTCPR